MPVALITGISGQDGAYLTQFLLNKDYEVHGVIRRKADNDFWRLEDFGVRDKVTLHYGDVTDPHSIERITHRLEYEPFEIYNLAAQSFVTASFDNPVSTFEINATGTINMLEAARKIKSRRGGNWVKFYQASTSEMFWLTNLEFQNELTRFHPRSPYGVAKLAAHWATINYRETYGLHACAGILFNHESPLRGEEFVTRKIVNSVVDIVTGKSTTLRLGNIDAVRDWGYAGDYVEAMWLMLQCSEPREFVIATGISHTVRDVCKFAFDYVGLDYNDYVVIDASLFRPCEVPVLKGCPILAGRALGWKPKYTFKDVIEEMMKVELRRKNAHVKIQDYTAIDNVGGAC